jgi:hypothetical protein
MTVCKKAADEHSVQNAADDLPGVAARLINAELAGYAAIDLTAVQPANRS